MTTITKYLIMLKLLQACHKFMLKKLINLDLHNVTEIQNAVILLSQMDQFF